jgi:hypothetical protein
MSDGSKKAPADWFDGFWAEYVVDNDAEPISVEKMLQIYESLVSHDSGEGD